MEPSSLVTLEILKNGLELLKTVMEGAERWRFSEKQRLRSDFLNYDSEFLCNSYNAVEPLPGRIPYSELACWLTDDFQTIFRASDRIDVKNLQGSFALRSDDLALKEFQVEALSAQAKKGRDKEHDEDVIHLHAVHTSPVRTELTIQKAKYNDQRQSNLVMDWEDDHALRRTRKAVSLRGYISAKYGHDLPPLSDSTLANTIGIAAIVFYVTEKGKLVPYLPQRIKEKNVGVFELGQYHCTASGAAAWNGRASFNDVFLRDIYAEMEEEVGLMRGDAFLAPAALCREFLRGGKPQLFFVGFTPLKRSELVQRRRAKLKEHEKKNKKRIEIQDRDLVLEDMSQLLTIEHNGISLEGWANLYYSRRFLTIWSHSATR